jgi:hypothetical protein
MQSRRIWRNAMVAAINAGLSQKHFGLGPDQNFWEDKFETCSFEVFVYEFSIDSIPAKASVANIGFGELAIHAAIWPTACNYRSAPKVIGRVEASGWLERLKGTYLQSAPLKIKAPYWRGKLIADLFIDPLG